jgi:hypothetical protein
MPAVFTYLIYRQLIDGDLTETVIEGGGDALVIRTEQAQYRLDKSNIREIVLRSPEDLPLSLLPSAREARIEKKSGGSVVFGLGRPVEMLKEAVDLIGHKKRDNPGYPRKLQATSTIRPA